MRLLRPLISLLVLAPIAFAATPAQDDKLEKLTALAKKSRSGVIPLTDALYADLVSTPRNYSAAVLLTAMNSKFGCHLCREFQPEYDILGASWLRQNHGAAEGLFFGVLDFSHGRDTFMKLGLNTAPVLFLFPPTVGPFANPFHVTDPIKFDFTQNTIPAERVANWIADHSPPHKPVVMRPFDYTNLVIGGSSTLVALTILKLSFNTLKPALYSRNLWSAISLILILLFTSGHMFNHIRKVPYVVNNGKGGVSYVAGGFSNQFGLETQIVAVIYAVLAFCTISLAMKMPRVVDPKNQKISIVIWSVLLLCAFSFLLALFRQKNGGYPFVLPPVM